MQNPSGVTLFDLSGYGRNGTLTNMDAPTDWVYSGGRRCLDFDGTNDRVTTGFDVPVTGPVTFALWVLPRTLNVYQGIISNHVSDTQAFEIFIDNAGSRFAGSAFSWNVTGTATANVWQHVAITKSNTTTMYVNGIATQNAANKSITQPSANLTIANRPSATHPFNGQLDDIRIYNRELTPAEIRQLATGRGIAYTPRRTVNYGSATTTNRRRTSMFLVAG